MKCFLELMMKKHRVLRFLAKITFIGLLCSCATQSSKEATAIAQEQAVKNQLAQGEYYINEPLPDALSQLLVEAQQLVQSEKYDSALNVLSDAKKQFPNYPQVDMNIAIIALKQNNHDLALDSVSAALEVRNEYPPALNMKGVIYRITGEFDSAKLAYEKAIQVAPDYPKPYLNLGILADLYLQNLTLALTSFEQYLNIVNADEKVENWIIDLKRRMPQESQ